MVCYGACVELVGRDIVHGVVLLVVECDSQVSMALGGAVRRAEAQALPCLRLLLISRGAYFELRCRFRPICVVMVVIIGTR